MFLVRGVKLSYASIALERRVKEYSKNNFLEPLTHCHNKSNIKERCEIELNYLVFEQFSVIYSCTFRKCEDAK